MASESSLYQTERIELTILQSTMLWHEAGARWAGVCHQRFLAGVQL